MEEFLRWVSVPALPLASLIVGFLTSLTLMSEREKRPGVGTIALGLVVVFLCAIQLVSDPVIDPIWLQYLLLIVVAGAVGAAIPPLFLRKRHEDAR